MPSIRDRFKNAWNAFRNSKPPRNGGYFYGSGRPDRNRLRIINERSSINVVLNRIAVDCASINILHVKVDEDGRYVETIKDSLNRALNFSANVDQTGRAMIQDAVQSMLDEGCIAIFPVEIDVNPNETDSYKIYELRVAKIMAWYPEEVLLEAYDERDGQRKQFNMEKRLCAIIENPFYAIMNESNSTQQRLMRTLAQLDQLNEDSCSGKMDLIVQLPYVVKNPAKQALAEQRRKDIEAQLTGSKYGIAYIDGTEKVIQLNRSLENNLWEQAKSLKEELFNQLGLSKAVFDGTADEATMLNYTNRTIEPILSAITEEMERKWISRTAQTQGQAIRFYKDPFKLIPVAQLAELADKFTRNEIATSNEIRTVLGMKPSKDPKADELVNSNLNQSNDKQPVKVSDEETNNKIQNK